MNEKLILLLETSRVHARDLIFMEELKDTIRQLEEKDNELVSGLSEGHNVPVSDRDNELCHLNQVLQDIRVELVRATEVFRSASRVATKCDLDKLGETIMSAIGDWVTTNGPKLDRIQSGLDTVQDLVEKLQNTAGTITPEDQALLNQIEQKIDAIASDADGIPPVPPVTPGA